MLLAACGEDVPPTFGPNPTSLPTLEPPPTINYGHMPTLDFAPLWIAAENLYFARQPLRKQPRLANDHDNMTAILLTGEVAIAAGPLGVGFFEALDDGQELVILASMTTLGDPSAVPVLTSAGAGGVGSMAELEGQRVGLPRGGVYRYLLAQALATADLTLEDVEVGEYSERQLQSGLAQGQFAAVLLPEARAAQAEEDGVAVVLSENYLPDGMQFAYIYTTRAYLEAEPENVSAFLAGMLMGCRDMAGELWYTERNLSIFRLYTAASMEALQATRPFGCEVDGAVDAADVEALRDFYVEQGLLSQTVDVTEIIDTSALERAVQSLTGQQP